MDIKIALNRRTATLRRLLTRRLRDPRIVMANDARDRHDWPTAARLYHQVLQTAPERANIWVQYGNMLKEDKRFEDAEAAYLEALKRIPNDADIHLQYGHLLKLANRLEESVEHYRQSALLDPARPDAQRELTALAQRGIYSAQEFFNQQTKPRPQYRTLNMKLAGTRMQIAEVMADLRERNARRNFLPENAEDLRKLDDAYKTIGLLLRGINSSRLNKTVRGISLDNSHRITVIFDISDLIQYFRHHRLPTGIQRVQTEVIYTALVAADPDLDIRVCCFTERYDYWREVPPSDFINLSDLSLTGNDWTSPDWRAAMLSLDAKLDGSPNFAFPYRSWLVNMGTSWWLQNYFLYVREAKSLQEINYVPFVHDMIPIKTPEYCVAGLTQDFISWALGVFLHANHFFVNSEATRGDLHEVAAKLGYEVADHHIHTVRLDADFRRGEPIPFDNSVLRTHRLTRNGYILFVATIEARKNHLAAFNAWIRLCTEYGSTKVPKLVCVGYRGWLNDAVYAKLDSSEELKEKVIMLSGVPDRDLAILYQGCLFTLFPSYYEGWGLPVTESLCYGKVPLVSKSSSLPEAGGEFAEYFAPGNEDELISALKLLMFDAEYRRRREALIEQKYAPRRWDDITDEIVTTVKGWSTVTGQDQPNHVPQVMLGRYYSMGRNLETRIYRSMLSGEIFRAGNAWWACDEFGCWTKKGPASIIMRVADDATNCRLYLGLRGLPERDAPFDAAVLSCPTVPTVRGVIKAGTSKWLHFDLELTGEPESVIHIVVEGHETGVYKSEREESPRTVGIGVIGFLLCRHDDIATRTNLVEAITLDNLNQLVKFIPEKEGDFRGVPSSNRLIDNHR